MKKSSIIVLVFLLVLLPGCVDLQYAHLVQTNNTNIAVPKIIEAITARDIDALEAMMCLNIRQNVDNLSEKIGDMIGSIDREIIETTRKKGTDISYSERREDGRSMVQSGFTIFFTTTTGTFRVGGIWETANNFAPEELGIRHIAVTNPDGIVLLIIEATEGVEEWHD